MSQRGKLSVFAIAIVMAIATVFAATASASGHGTWYHHVLKHNVVCNQDSQTAYDAGPFDTKAACEAYHQPPPPSECSADWPASTGTLDGNAVAYPNGSVVLTSADDSFGYGALNFDVSGSTTFANTGVTFGFTVLSGSIGAGSPRISITLANGDTWFVYSYDVNPGGDVQNYENGTQNPGVYLTRTDAMTQAGSQLVTGAALVVDNGDLSISVCGVTIDGSHGGNGIIPQVNNVHLLYSGAYNDNAKVFDVKSEISHLMSTSDHYDIGAAIKGATPTGIDAWSIGGYGVVSTQHIPSGDHFTGQWLSDDTGVVMTFPGTFYPAGATPNQLAILIAGPDGTGLHPVFGP